MNQGPCIFYLDSTKMRGHPERKKKRQEIHKRHLGSTQDYGPKDFRMMTWEADPEGKQFIWDEVRKLQESFFQKMKLIESI